MGGQKGDTGVYEMDDGTIIEIEQVQKFAGVILHFVKG
jgi:alanyl-tRNA synthetase